MKSMLKVFLVEDEYVIREAIRTTVDWNANGFELVGEAGDGEKACQMILKCEPDILITDIRMPFMDGLELSRLVRRRLPETKIVILSGYDDFSYAKEAISIGVTEYLLKPVTEAKLLETLNRIGESIEAERSRQSFREVYEAERAELQKLEKHRFIRDLIDGRIPMGGGPGEGAGPWARPHGGLVSGAAGAVCAGRGRRGTGGGGRSGRRHRRPRRLPALCGSLRAAGRRHLPPPDGGDAGGAAAESGNGCLRR